MIAAPEAGALKTSEDASIASAKSHRATTRSPPWKAIYSKSFASSFKTFPGSATAFKLLGVKIIAFSNGMKKTQQLKSLASSAKACPTMSEAKPMVDPNTKTVDYGIKFSVGSFGKFPNTAKAKIPTGSDLKTQDDGERSAKLTTEHSLNFTPSLSSDPFGTRSSTSESGLLQFSFDLANAGKFNSVRDNILNAGGHRVATAHFEHLPAKIIQPLQPCLDLMTESIKLQMAATAERKADKAKELDAIKAEEIIRASGLYEPHEKIDQTYLNSVRAAVEATRLEATDNHRAWDNISKDDLGKLRAEAKGKHNQGQSFGVAHEEQSGQSASSRSPNAPIEEKELGGKSWAFPIADGVIDKAQFQNETMYDVVTAMQRSRLDLGHETSDYDVIACAHADYVSHDAEEVTTLTRAAEVQKTTALTYSVAKEMQEAQSQGHPLTNVAGLSLSQEDITEVLERCAQVGSSSSAALDFMEAKNEAADGNYAKNLFPLPPAAGRSSTGRAPRTHFKAMDKAVDTELANVLSVEGKPPVNFGPELVGIQRELASLKSDCVNYPGDKAGMVPGSIDDEDYDGIAVHEDDLGLDEQGSPVESELAVGGTARRVARRAAGTSTDGAAGNAAASAATAAKKPSRAEQRRAARQKAKAKA